MKRKLLLMSVILLLAGCAKQSQELIEPNPADEANLLIESTRVDLENNDAVPEIPKEEIAVENISPEIPQLAAGTNVVVNESPNNTTSSNDPEPTVATENLVPAVPEEPVFLDQRKPKFDYTQEVLFPDSAWDKYMINKGDFLIKIAKNEYNDWTMWRSIYNWNKEEIGDDPNIIYPYHWLDLLKPSDQVDACKLTFFQRQTKTGESLWTIAKDVYGDEYAWIVLFWDNEELIETNEGVLYPGMELQIRENIDPCNVKS